MGDYVSGDGVQGRPWDVAGNRVLAMEYGSLYYRPADLSNVTMKLVKCGEPSREGLCLSDTSDLLEACTVKNRKLRLVQKSKVQRKHGKLSLILALLGGLQIKFVVYLGPIYTMTMKT